MLTAEKIPGIINFIRTHLTTLASVKPVHLAVNEGEWQLDDEWLYVHVRPTRTGERASDYADAMMEVERDLRANGIENVLLVPVRSE